jgi:purine nucleosidase
MRTNTFAAGTRADTDEPLRWTAQAVHGLVRGMTRRPIIIDTDPGLDDAVAILLAFASPEVEVLGITAVAGNVGVDLTAANARRLCGLAGRRDAKVFAGCSRPMLRAPITAVVHGETGLGGADLPPPEMPLQDRHAVDWIIETVMGSPERSVTICALGPLTNLALAVMREPRLPARLHELVIMGGAGPSGGNSTPTAEFNIYFDPHAAHVVFDRCDRIVLVPLDVTRQVLATRDRVARIRAIGSPVGRAVAGMLEFFNRGEGFHEGLEAGPLHDPCVIAYLLRPSLFRGRAAHVEIETQSPRTLGMTIIDTRLHGRTAANAQVLLHADADGFYDLLIERLATL